jgi:6-phosphogluconolactonase
MGQPLFFKNPEELAAAVARKWIKQLRGRKTATSAYLVALSGGRITKQFFSAVTQEAKAERGLFDTVHFFWGDERCVPPDNPESNFGIARDLLFEPLGIAEPRVHRIQGELNPEVAAAKAESELRTIAPINKNGQPVCDLVFLGMGEDGHVASLFPGESEEARASKAVYRTVVATKPPPQRITLGYPCLAAGKEIWVLASGAGKENALKDSLSGGETTPLGRVRDLNPETHVFTDIRL